MSFRIDPALVGRTWAVYYESEHIWLQIGVIAKDRDKWQLHHAMGSSNLTAKGLDEVTALVGEKIASLNVTDRLTS